MAGAHSGTEDSSSTGLDDAIALAAGDRQQADALYLTPDGHARTVMRGILTTADLVPGYLATDRL